MTNLGKDAAALEAVLNMLIDFVADVAQGSMNSTEAYRGAKEVLAKIDGVRREWQAKETKDNA